MKLLRHGPKGAEKPALLDAQGQVRDLSKVLADISPATLTPKGLQRLRKSSSEQGSAGDGIGQKLDDLMAAVGGYDVVGGG